MARCFDAKASARSFLAMDRWSRVIKIAATMVKSRAVMLKTRAAIGIIM
jgi:hypothetical protein